MSRQDGGKVPLLKTTTGTSTLDTCHFFLVSSLFLFYIHLLKRGLALRTLPNPVVLSSFSVSVSFDPLKSTNALRPRLGGGRMRIWQSLAEALKYGMLST
jgi:hypothetical protein